MRRDPVLSTVLRFVREDLPADSSCSSSDVGSYKSRVNELSIHEDCLMWDRRQIIPSQVRKALLDELHKGYFGASRMNNRWRIYFWWLGVDRDIENVVSPCSICQEQMPSAPRSECVPGLGLKNHDLAYIWLLHHL